MTWCILADCNQLQCHHCFPVINCSENHCFCNLYGCCIEIWESGNPQSDN